MSVTIDNPAEVFSRPNDEARIHDFEQFTLWAPTPERPGHRARMTFGERNGAPRITVFTNVEGVKPLYVGMAPVIWYDFLRRFEQLAKGEVGKSCKIDNMAAGKSEDGQKAPPVLRNSLWYGKDENGVCWLSIEQVGAPRIRFQILSSHWHYFYKTDGTKLTPEECSVSQTLATIEGLRAAAAPYVARIRRPFDKTQATKAQPKGSIPASAGASMSSTSSGYMDDDIPY